ncbi:MAG: hypothetical protein KDK99_12545 [Verrucomicrobiales bacterium]|nr:hypothetical protein [Verrucomicrobiales bacterium]
MKTLLLCLVLGGMAGLLGWLLARPNPAAVELAQTREALTNAQLKIESLEADLERSQRTLQKKAGAEAKLKAEPFVAPGTAVAADSLPALPSALKEPGEGGMGAALTKMMESPGMKNMIRSQQAAVIQMQYGKLMDQFQLTPEERENFETLLLDRQMAQVEMGMKLMKEGISEEERQAAVDEMKRYQEASTAAIRQFLNDDGDFATFQHWEKTAPDRMMMEMIGRGIFTGSDKSLSAEQETQLIDLMMDARTQTPAPGTPRMPDPLNPGVVGPEEVEAILQAQARQGQRVLDQAASFLSTPQLEALKAYLEQQANMTATGLHMSSTLLKGKER